MTSFGRYASKFQTPTLTKLKREVADSPPVVLVKPHSARVQTLPPGLCLPKQAVLTRSAGLSGQRGAKDQIISAQPEQNCHQLDSDPR